MGGVFALGAIPPLTPIFVAHFSGLEILGRLGMGCEKGKSAGKGEALPNFLRNLSGGAQCARDSRIWKGEKAKKIVFSSSPLPKVHRRTFWGLEDGFCGEGRVPKVQSRRVGRVRTPVSSIKKRN